MSAFCDRLQAQWQLGRFVSVGLDTNPTQIPPTCRDLEPEMASWLKFNVALIDATADIACAFKPNLAFYLGQGSEGVAVLEETCQYIKDMYPEVILILDMKSADIGQTNQGYAHFAYDFCRADAMTVHHKHGLEAMRPYLDRADKGVIVVVRTSNPGADEFQCERVEVGGRDAVEMEERGFYGQEIDGTHRRAFLEFEHAAWRVRRHWNYKGNCAVVAGATNEGLARVRQIVGDLPILIPGIGRQGGDLEPAVRHGRDAHFQGMIINSSSGVTGASKGADFAEAARAETQRLTDLINQYRLES